MMKNPLIVVSILCLVLAAHALAAASGDGSVEITMVAEMEIEVRNEDGTTEIQRVPAQKVVPGDEVIYTIRYRNAGDESAEKVTITNPIPEHMIYQSVDPIDEVTTVVLSVDGGDHYDLGHELVVVDANGNERPAEPEDYTHVRWIFGRPLAAGSEGQVSFRARLK